jgi:histidinol phosphatase-like enzyme (inositol monophosphatase family)
MSPRLAFALNAAHEAGRWTLAQFQTGTGVEIKADGSPVTEADRGAERIIRQFIQEEFPGEAILGEEEGGERGDSGWVVDPIDGTKSFVCGVPLFATLISYEDHGEPIVGVCAFPALGEVVYAERGGGACWNGRPCRVSSRANLRESYVSSGSQFSMAKAGRAEGFQKLVDSARATRTWSDAYGHALVATGRIEAMIDPIVAPWDISAMRVIVREAGGRFTDFSGGSDPQTEAIASNGILHDRILEAFAG